MSGRNCSEPVARLRNAGACGHSVTYLLRGLDDPLWLWPEHDILARIISKCRCAKRERKHDARTSDRPAAPATWSAYCFHDPIVVRLRILRKRIRPPSWDRDPTFRARRVKMLRQSTSVRPKKVLQAKIVQARFCFFAATSAAGNELVVDCSGGFPLRVLLQ